MISKISIYDNCDLKYHNYCKYHDIKYLYSNTEFCENVVDIINDVSRFSVF